MAKKSKYRDNFTYSYDFWNNLFLIYNFCDRNSCCLTIALLVLVNFYICLVPTKMISDTNKQNDVDKRQYLIIGSVTAFLFLIICILVSCLLIRRKCKQHTLSMENQIAAYSVSVVSNGNINAHVDS